MDLVHVLLPATGSCWAHAMNVWTSNDVSCAFLTGGGQQSVCTPEPSRQVDLRLRTLLHDSGFTLTPNGEGNIVDILTVCIHCFSNSLHSPSNLHIFVSTVCI